jgi:hypothetical protein
MVIGIELFSSLSCSTCWTCFRKLTKWLLNISWDSADKRGAHLLENSSVSRQPSAKKDTHVLQ